jgi:perosamine synthetase
VRVPFSDVSYDLTTRLAVDDVLKSGWASKGRYCDEFQAELEKYLGSHVALVNNGSSALMVALLANGVKAGDTVLVPDLTYVATASVPAILGCKIVPVDADLETFNMIPCELNGGIVIGTDVAGLPERGGAGLATYIEDGAEALGAERVTPTLGDTRETHKVGADRWLTTFSFQATKVLNTVEGGAIASKDEELIEKCRRIADYGRTKERYVHDLLGMNFRMNDIQAAIGLVGLEDLEDNLKRRQEIADRYRKEIPSLTFQKVPSYVTRHAYWAVIGVAQNQSEWARMSQAFNEGGIDARGVWTPIHLQPCFPELNKNPMFDNAVRIWKRGFLLPIYNSMPEEYVDEVIRVANS